MPLIQIGVLHGKGDGEQEGGKRQRVSTDLRRDQGPVYIWDVEEEMKFVLYFCLQNKV